MILGILRFFRNVNTDLDREFHFGQPKDFKNWPNSYDVPFPYQQPSTDVYEPS